MADSNDVDEALVEYLAGDAALQALLPGGVWFDVAPPGVINVLILWHLDHVDDNNAFEQSAWEVFTYGIRAVTVGIEPRDGTPGLQARL